MYLKIDRFQGLECVCSNASLSLGSHLVGGCSDAVPVAEGCVQDVLCGLSCLHITTLQRLLCKWHFPQSAALQLIWGFCGRGGGRALSLGGRSMTEPAVVERAQNTVRCELGVPLAQSVAAAALSVSPGVVCVKEHELKADLLCHPDFGFCHCEFLFSFWKLLSSSLLGSPGGIETHRGAHPEHPPSHI